MIGVYANVNPGVGAPAVQPAPLNTVGLIVKSNRGPLNTILPITSIGNYEAVWGKPLSNASSEVYHSYYTAKAIFDECGSVPAFIYAVRPGSGGVAAFHNATAGLFTITAAYQGYESVGTYGNRLSVTLTQNGTSGIWSLTVYETDPVSGTVILKEPYTDLTASNFLSTINTKRPSNYIKVTANGTSAVTLVELSAQALSGGTNPTAPDNTVVNSALSYFDNYNINYLIAPDFMNNEEARDSGALVDLLHAYTYGRVDCLAVTCAPSSYTWDTVSNWGIPRQSSIVFGSGYFGWVRIDDLYGVERTIPPIGFIVGAYYIKKAQLDGNIAHSAPGGVVLSIKTIKGLVAANQILSNTQVDFVKSSAGMNTIQFLQGFGYVLQTSRSFSTDSRFYNIHRIRSICYLIQSLRPALLYFNQMPSNPTVRSMASGVCENFVGRQYELGMFDSDEGRDEAYRIVCTASNNPAAVKIQRWLVVDIYIKLVEVNELVRINFNPVEIGNNFSIQ